MIVLGLSISANTSLAQGNISELNGLGLYQTESEGRLSADLWQDMQRADIMDLVSALPSEFVNMPARRLALGLLLSQSPFPPAENNEDEDEDKGGVPTAGFLTLRLEKLIEMGAYDQAFALYNKLDQTPPDGRLARAGILAMLFNGETSLACLESKTFLSEFDKPDSDTAFWEALEGKCNEDTADENSDPFIYTASDLKALPVRDRALTAANRNMVLTALNNDIHNIPAEHIQVLLKQNALTDDQRLVLTIKGVESGLIKPADLSRLYTRLSPDIDDIDKQTTDLASLYALIQNSNDQDQRGEYAKTALRSAEDPGYAALAPFIPSLLSLSPLTLTTPEISLVLKAFALTDEELPRHWKNEIREKFASQLESGPDSKSESEPALTDSFVSKFKILTAVRLIDSRAGSGVSLPEGLFYRLSDTLLAPDAYFLKEVYENIDKPDTNSHNASQNYENRFDLTFYNDYVMPNYDIWQRIVKAGQEDNLALTALLSVFVLHNQTLADMYPGLFMDLYKSLNRVGLTKTASNIGVLAVLDLEKNKGEN